MNKIDKPSQEQFNAAKEEKRREEKRLRAHEREREEKKENEVVVHTGRCVR
jgi:hypothetical protein